MPPKMRERFASFQRKTSSDLSNLWATAEFSFDANVLLNLYESPRLVVNQFGEYLAKMGPRFYLTDQVVLEFYRNREKVIRQALDSLSTFDDLLASLPAAFSENAQKQLEKLIESEKNNLEKFLADGDSVEKCISDAVGDRIDPPCDDVVSLFEKIDKRYAAQVPPGFADSKEKDDYKRYGDAILWLQAITHQKLSRKPLILVTADEKYDWWLKDNQNKTVGPRPELAHEMWENAQVHFHLYSFKQFLVFAAKQWPQKSGDKAGEEAVKVVEKMELEREAAIQSEAETDQLAKVVDAWGTPPTALDLAQSLAREQQVIRNWDALERDSVWGNQAKLNAIRAQVEALRSNAIQSYPGPNSLFSYTKALEQERNFRQTTFRDYLLATRREALAAKRKWSLFSSPQAAEATEFQRPASNVVKKSSSKRLAPKKSLKKS